MRGVSADGFAVECFRIAIHLALPPGQDAEYQHDACRDKDARHTIGPKWNPSQRDREPAAVSVVLRASAMGLDHEFRAEEDRANNGRPSITPGISTSAAESTVGAMS